MERNWLLVIIIFFTTVAHSDVVLISPKIKGDNPGSEILPSRFGQHAPQPNLKPSVPEEPMRGLASIVPQKSAQEEVKDYIPMKNGGVQEVSVIAGQAGYYPKTVFVTREIPVRMYVTGVSSGPLCIMMDAFNVRKQIQTDKVEEIVFVPSVPGQYRFHCPLNGLEGTLVVRDVNQNSEVRQPANETPEEE